ncbi:MAG: hypothetical protein ABIO81_14235 [Ginsengibacter sp.]
MRITIRFPTCQFIYGIPTMVLVSDDQANFVLDKVTPEKYTIHFSSTGYVDRN